MKRILEYLKERLDRYLRWLLSLTLRAYPKINKSCLHKHTTTDLDQHLYHHVYEKEEEHANHMADARRPVGGVLDCRYLQRKSPGTVGRPAVPYRKVLDGILYILRTGCQMGLFKIQGMGIWIQTAHVM
jgi:hypothetical protein